MKKPPGPGSSTDDRLNQRGFSLVELLISSAIVLFLIVGTAQLALHSLVVKRRADCNLKTAELASSKLEYLKSLPYESDELKEGLQTETLRGEGPFDIFRREWKIQDISWNMKRVEIESFSESYPQKKTRMVLFLSRELGF